jgi:hypothetical protein
MIWFNSSKSGFKGGSQHCSQAGLSLIELIMVVMAVAFLALLIVNLPSSISTISKSRHTSIARDIVTKKIDAFRKADYNSLSNGLNSFSDPNLNNLPRAAAIYGIEDCPLSVCALGESAKKVTVKVSWNETGDIKKVELSTIISEGGIGK